MSKRTLVLKFILPIVLLAVGMGGMVVMIKGRRAPVRQEQAFRGTLVETRTVERTDRRLTVTATGTVQPLQQADIVVRVSGTVIEISPNLSAGGFFRTGDLLFSIEKVDYELALERARAALSTAELERETIEARAAVARQEWESLNPGQKPSPLAVFVPQLKSAETAVRSAKAALRQAELDLERTRLRAPFNCYVRSKFVDIGQYVRAGTKAVTVVGTDRVEIVVPLPLADMHLLDVPRAPGRKGSPAVVTLRDDGKTWTWRGWIARSLAEVDPRGRMARVVVEVADPYGRNGNDNAKPELAVGSFVEVSLEGAVLSDVVVVPREALRDGDTVWLMTDESTLRIVPVEVARRERDALLVSSGLAGGERVVLTTISGAADGMLLRTAENN